MRLPTAQQPATILRAALTAPWPRVAAAARHVVAEAISEASTLGEAAALLGVSRDTLERIRSDFPGVFEIGKNRPG